MRKAKLNRQRTKKIKQHTIAERMALRREKKRVGPCGMRRREWRRKQKQDEFKKIQEVQRQLQEAVLVNETKEEHAFVVVNVLASSEIPSAVRRDEVSNGN